MYCMHCGTELPDKARFCWNCGKPQTADVQAEEPQYETCEIVFTYTRKPAIVIGDNCRLQFWARAIGPDGAYNAGESLEFAGDYGGPNAGKSHHAKALHGLVAQLTSEGWQPLTRGEHWYSHNFQRRVTGKTAVIRAEEQGAVDLVLVDAGPRIMETIKAIHALTKWDLVRAKALAQTRDGVVLSNVPRSTALQAQALLEEAGATTKIV